MNEFSSCGGDNMPQSNSQSSDSKNQTLTKESEHEKRNMPKGDLVDEE
jgi:hypothetical protein